MPEVDSKLATALRQAKQQPMFFAFVAVGASDGVLLVSKKAIPVKEINEAKSESGGKKVYKGRCQAVDGQMVFEMAKEPPGTLAKALKKTIHESAGMMLQVETRIAPDLTEEDEGGENSSQEVPTAPPEQQQQQAATNDLPSRFTAKLKALAPIVQKLEGNNTPAAVSARQAIADANGQFRTQNYNGALDSLTTAEGLLKQALLAGAQAQQHHANDNPEAATFAKELERVEQLVNACLKANKGDTGKMRALLAFAQEKGEAGQYPAALQSLKTLEALAQQAQTAQEPTPQKGTGIAYRKAQLRWEAAKSETKQVIQDLIAKASKDFPDEAESLKIVNEIVTDLNLGLSDTLDAAENAETDNERAPLHAQAVELIKDYVDLVENSELVEYVDNNPWTQPNIRTTLMSALNELSKQIR